MFELRPTRRKAAALERVRAAAEAAFWTTMEAAQPVAVAAAVQDRKARRDAAGRLAQEALVTAAKTGLPEPVAQGLARDLAGAAGAYVEARAKGREASWPQPVAAPVIAPLADRLDDLAAAITQDEEAAARDALNRRPRLPRARPIILARERDCRILRDDKGRLAVALNVQRASDPRAREATIRAGYDACTGEVHKAQRRRTVLMVPLVCGRWHENKFLSGEMRLCSAIVYPRDGRWWLQAQFAIAIAPGPQTGAVLGVDRGVAHPVAMAVVDRDGTVQDVPGRRGDAIGKAVTARKKMLAQQQRAGTERFRRRLGRAAAATRSAGETRARTRSGRFIDQSLHVLANEIADLARQHGARVAVEKLDGLKAAMGTKRASGARRGGWGTVLRKAQLAKLERMLAYKLPLAGLPPLREVIAAGTSRTCPACGHVDPKSRPEQATFSCTGCSFAHNADDNAAVIIARRGTFEIRKGDKLDALHMNMVEGLKSRDDGGLGPLAAFRRRVVAGHVSAAKAYDPVFGLTLVAGQKSTHAADEKPDEGYSQSAMAALSQGGDGYSQSALAAPLQGEPGRRRGRKRSAVEGQGVLPL